MGNIVRALYDERRERVRAMFNELEQEDRDTVKLIMDIYTREHPEANSVESTWAFVTAVEDVYARHEREQEHARAMASVWAVDE